MGVPMNIKELRAANRFAIESESLEPAAKAIIYRLIDEVRRLRQGLWDVAAISGSDTDGQATPDAMTFPDIVEYAKREVQSLRNDYDAEYVCLHLPQHRLECE